MRRTVASEQMRSDRGYIELYCTALHSTDKALLCDFGDSQQWIPHNHIHDDSDVYKPGDKGEILVTEWIAREKGLI